LLGFGPYFAAQLDAADAGLVPARVMLDAGSLCHVDDGTGERVAALAGRLRLGVGAPDTAPVAGDWVLIRQAPAGAGASIVRVLARRTRLARRAAGGGQHEQVLAANVDTVFVVQALDADFSLRRLERYLAAVRDGGAQPVVLLNKADTDPDAAVRRTQARAVAQGAEVLATSARHGTGVEQVAAHLAPGRTAALVGSSGVGKSTLLNRLAGRELQRVAGVREADGKGRHTTSARRLIRLDGGALLLDTPGMREFGLIDAADGLGGTFEDVEALAAACRFRDCAHEAEPDCAVRAAAEQGRLDPARLESWRKLAAEARHEAVQADPLLRRERERRWRAIHRSLRAMPKKG